MGLGGWVVVREDSFVRDGTAEARCVGAPTGHSKLGDGQGYGCGTVNGWSGTGWPVDGRVGVMVSSGYG